jgi:hypothetical protein
MVTAWGDRESEGNCFPSLHSGFLSHHALRPAQFHCDWVYMIASLRSLGEGGVH